MVRLKYAPGISPLVNEHQGYTFQNSRIGQTAMSGQKNDRARQSRQMNKKANLMQAVTNWRNLSAAAKTNWNNFAATYPQPCKNPDNGFLTGYQLFIKRQQYLFLNNNLQTPFMESPVNEALILPLFSFSIDQTENSLDVSENYIKNFGVFPSVGSHVLLKAVVYSAESGQFFPVYCKTIQVNEVYLDGLFISLHLPANSPKLTFSVYLSKPVHPSVVYSGTKTRYMGCFTIGSSCDPAIICPAAGYVEDPAPVSTILLNNTALGEISVFYPPLGATGIKLNTNNLATDVAHTTNRLWIKNNSTLWEYILTLSPFSLVFNRSLTGIDSSPALCAIDNTTLLTARSTQIYINNISGASVVRTIWPFTYASMTIEGDILFTTNRKVIILGRNSAISTEHYIRQFDWDTGVLEFSKTWSDASGQFGLFCFGNLFYIAMLDRRVFSIMKEPPYTMTLVCSALVTTGLNGASTRPDLCTISFTPNE